MVMKRRISAPNLLAHLGSSSKDEVNDDDAGSSSSSSSHPSLPRRQCQSPSSQCGRRTTTAWEINELPSAQQGQNERADDALPGHQEREERLRIKPVVTSSRRNSMSAPPLLMNSNKSSKHERVILNSKCKSRRRGSMSEVVFGRSKSEGSTITSSVQRLFSSSKRRLSAPDLVRAISNGSTSSTTKAKRTTNLEITQPLLQGAGPSSPIVSRMRRRSSLNSNHPHFETIRKSKEIKRRGSVLSSFSGSLLDLDQSNHSSRNRDTERTTLMDMASKAHTKTDSPRLFNHIRRRRSLTFDRDDEKEEQHNFGCHPKLVKQVKVLHQEAKKLNHINKQGTKALQSANVFDILQKIVDAIDEIRLLSATDHRSKNITSLFLSDILIQGLVSSTVETMKLYKTKAKVQRKSCQVLGYVLCNCRHLNADQEVIQDTMASNQAVVLILSAMTSFNGIKQALHKEALYALSSLLMIPHKSSSIEDQFSKNKGIQRVMDSVTQFSQCNKEVAVYGLTVLRFLLTSRNFRSICMLTPERIPYVIDVCVSTMKSNFKCESVLHNGLVLLYEFSKQEGNYNNINGFDMKPIFIARMNENHLSSFLIACMEQHIHCGMVQGLCCSLMTFLCRNSSVARRRMIEDDVESIIKVSLSVHSYNKCVQLEGSRALMFLSIKNPPSLPSSSNSSDIDSDDSDSFPHQGTSEQDNFVAANETRRPSICYPSFDDSDDQFGDSTTSCYNQECF